MRNNSEFYEVTHGDSGRHLLTRIRAHAWVILDPEGNSQVNFKDSSSYVCDEESPTVTQ